MTLTLSNPGPGLKLKANEPIGLYEYPNGGWIIMQLDREDATVADPIGAFTTTSGMVVGLAQALGVDLTALAQSPLAEPLKPYGSIKNARAVLWQNKPAFLKGSEGGPGINPTPDAFIEKGNIDVRLEGKSEVPPFGQMLDRAMKNTGGRQPTIKEIIQAGEELVAEGYKGKQYPDPKLHKEACEQAIVDTCLFFGAWKDIDWWHVAERALDEAEAKGEEPNWRRAAIDLFIGEMKEDAAQFMVPPYSEMLETGRRHGKIEAVDELKNIFKDLPKYPDVDPLEVPNVRGGESASPRAGEQKPAKKGFSIFKSKRGAK